MLQSTDTGSRAGTGYAQTPCRGNEDLDRYLGAMVVSSTTPRGSNLHMAAGTEGRFQCTANSTRTKRRHVRQRITDPMTSDSPHWRLKLVSGGPYFLMSHEFLD